MAIPFDITLIDRELLKKGIWENFIAWQKDRYEHDQQDDSTYILLDEENIQKSEIPLKIKQLYMDFNSDYEKLFEFLKYIPN